MKVLSLNDLHPADVLLFSPEKKSFISWAITFLTDAPVSHAAMYFETCPPTIVEETPPQVTTNPAEKRFKGRTIHVYRHTTASPLTPVTQAARQHLNNQEPYDHAGLYMVGLLLMCKILDNQPKTAGDYSDTEKADRDDNSVYSATADAR